jgi:hypothetical protein
MQSDVLANLSTADATKTDPRAGKYLTFQLANSEFAVQVLHLHEITGVQEITAVRQMQGSSGSRSPVEVSNIGTRIHNTCIIVVQIKARPDASLRA